MKLDKIATRLVNLLSDSLKFPELKTVKKYARIGKKFSVPAALIEIGDFDSFEDHGNEQLDLGVRFEIRFVVQPELNNADELVRILAARAASLIHKQDRNYIDPDNPDDQYTAEDIGPFQILDISEDHFRPELSNLLVWLLQIRCEVLAGDDVFAPGPDDIDPAEVTLKASQYPDIGPGHEDDYVTLYEVQP